ncbi:Hypothetical predicted protein [Cloeon dipterum]|uniref:L-Fucosyltransferase n=1 Tax=Cloeon dipterum TaxID=197152 RepID=A0A8S1C9A5_9INSE|nr:Hypothetical predicted protein [Cloeon dipterum]
MVGKRKTQIALLSAILLVCSLLLLHAANVSLIFADPETSLWLSCPEPGSTFVTADVGGRLGNIVWTYLSVVAAARRHNLRPVIDQRTLDVLSTDAFERNFLRVPSVEWLDRRCGLKGALTHAVRNRSERIASRQDFFSLLEEFPQDQIRVLKYKIYATDSELTTAFWNELKKELVLKTQLQNKADSELRRIGEEFQARTGIKATHVEFVGIHVRRTDYGKHLSIILPGSVEADSEFFHAAIEWLKKRLRKPLIFVVVSDDPAWTQQYIVGNRSEIFLAGSSNIDEPGEDLAILAACQHSIFAYGTFGLTAAFLASRPGGHTVLFDPRNGGVTKEMEFGANLPGWHIMDQHGNLTYQNTPISFHYFLHPHQSREWD